MLHPIRHFTSAYKLNKQDDNKQPRHTPFPNLEPVCCSMSSCNCCFLTCIQISQEAGQVVWYSHLFQNFPCYCDPSVKGFGIVLKRFYMQLNFFLQRAKCILVFSCIMYYAKLLQLCPTLCEPTDSSPPGSSVYGILRARVLE